MELGKFMMIYACLYIALVSPCSPVRSHFVLAALYAVEVRTRRDHVEDGGLPAATAKDTK